MKKLKMKCIAVDGYIPGRKEPIPLFQSTPGPHMGHNLITCLTCGAVYAANVSAQIYLRSIDQQVENLECLTCYAPLRNNYAPFPENAVIEGQVYHFDRRKLPAHHNPETREIEYVTVDLYDIYD